MPLFASAEKSAVFVGDTADKGLSQRPFYHQIESGVHFMELGSWSLITSPSLLALIPLIVMIVLIFMGKSNVSAIMVGIFVGALLMGQDLGDIAGALSSSLSSSTALMGLIIMCGAGLGVLMSEAHVTHTLVYWIVKRIGVDSQTKAKIALIICSILVCGLLGTMGGGNAVIAPIMLPILATVGVTPTVVATLFKIAGEIGLMLGPLTGVTLITMEVTGLSYGELMIEAVIPFSIFWLAGAWVGCIRAQKRTFGKESYVLGEDMKDLNAIEITPKQARTTIAFLVSFLLLITYGIISQQGTSYALIVIIVLAAVVAIFAGIDIDSAVDAVTKGVASQANMFLIFVSIDTLLNLVTLGGGFDALADLLGGIAQGGGPTGVMLIASVVGGFGIEAAAVAEIKIIAEMFGGMATQVGLPMGCFAVAILSATRLTGTTYPTTNFAGQMGTAQCDNTKEALQACWISVAFAVVFVVAYAFIGPMILS